MEALREQVYTLRESLEAPIADVEQLEELLASPARWLGLLPSSSSQNQSDFEKLEHSLRATFVDKHLASIQSILLRRIYVDWKEQLETHNPAATAFDALFMPSAHHTEARLVGLSAVSLILSLFGDTKRTPLHTLSVSYALYTLEAILELHPPDAVYSALCQLSPPGKETNPLRWLDAVKLYFSIPDRVSNFAGTSSHNNITVPSHLHWPAVMQGYTLATVRLLSAEASADPAYHMLSKLVNVGFVSAVPPRSERSSFWPLALSAVRPDHIQDNNAASNWRSSISELSTRQKQILLTALLQHMSVAILPDDGYSQEHADRQTIVAAANMLHCLFGPFSYSWASPCIEREGWGISVARLLVAWGSFSGQVDALLKASSAAWIDVLSIERSSPDHRQYLTCLVVLTSISLTPHSSLISFASSEDFLQGVQRHLSTNKPEVRFQGMITAELLSSFTIGHQADLKPLSFGEDVWKAAPAQQADRCKRLKNLAMGLTDVLAVPLASAGLLRFDAHQDPKSTKEGIIDDHISSTKPQYNHFKLYQTPRSQNSPAPTKPKIQVLSSDDSDDDFIPYDMPTEDDAVLAEGEDISTFTQPKDKPKPPVYLADLANYLKSSEDVNKIELGLAYAATLIRKRAAWGTELDELASELVFSLIGLHDAFELEGFAEQRQEALTALLASSPKNAAPTLVEQYYSSHYSVDQRFAMLTALALSARELAGLDRSPKAKVSTFIGKELPSETRRKLVEFEGSTGNTDSIDQTVYQVTSSALADFSNNDATPQASYFPQKNQLSGENSKKLTPQAIRNNFTSIAESCFVMPLVNRMWLALHHTGSQEGLFIPLLLARFFGTLSILVHASASTSSLANMLAEVTKLALALRGSMDDDAEVLASQLELLLVSFQAATSRPSVQNQLMRHFDSRETVFRSKAWAEDVWTVEENRGGDLSRLGRSAAGLVLITEKLCQM